MLSQYPRLVLLGFLGACFAVAALGSWVTTPAVDTWYTTVRKPPWTPPNWVFGPVWSALYAAMALAAWWVWQQRGSIDVRLPLTLFAIQLLLNLAWSVLFFGLQNPGAGLIEIVVLWSAILATLLAFWRVSVGAGWLLVPYLLWVTFALALNFSIWQLNS
ncbi:MAG: TspO/MBR family protein [Candidatus Binatia bacterium]